MIQSPMKKLKEIVLKFLWKKASLYPHLPPQLLSLLVTNWSPWASIRKSIEVAVVEKEVLPPVPSGCYDKMHMMWNQSLLL